MTTAPAAAQRWHRLALALGAVFVALGVAGFAASLGAARCLDDSRPAADRLLACALASALTPARFSPADRGEFVRIIVERAIVLAETGAPDRALAAVAGLAGADRQVIAERLGRLAPASAARPILEGALAHP